MNEINKDIGPVETAVVEAIYETLEPEQLQAFGEFLKKMSDECLDEYEWHFGDDIDDDDE